MAFNYLGTSRRNSITRSKELSRLATLRESQNPSHLWKFRNQNVFQDNALTNGTSAMNRHVARKNKPLYVDLLFYPFKTYLVPVDFCPPDGTEYVGSSALYSRANDAFRTFQIRDGFASGRSKHVADSANALFFGSNFENVFHVVAGTDHLGLAGTFNWDFQAELYAADPFPARLPSDGSETPNLNNHQFVLADTVDDPNTVGAAFWIDLKDTTAGLSPVIRGRMFATVAFPGPSPHIIPIATVTTPLFTPYDPSIKQQLQITQYTFNHVINRYCPGYSDGFDSAPLFYRGNWDDDSLSGQTFYPGDVVQVYSNNGLQVALFEHDENYQVETQNPADFPTRWKQLTGWSVLADPT